MDIGEDNFDYYDILNVTPQSTNEDIKSSYRKLLRQWHPDKRIDIDLVESCDSVNSDKSEYDTTIDNQIRDTAFIKIQKAYGVLSDPQLRDLYDKHGSEAVSLAILLRHEDAKENVEHLCIAEDLEDAEKTKESNELAKVPDEYLETRVGDLLQNRRWQRIKELPVQVVTNFTFSSAFRIFDYGYIKRRLFQINQSAVENSIEVSLPGGMRFGYSFLGLISRNAFGSSRTGLYLIRKLSENLEGTAALEYSNFWSYRGIVFHLKRRFGDFFWSSLVCSFESNTKIPKLAATVHKKFGNNHSIELSMFPGIVGKYAFVKRFERDLKLNFQVAASPEDAVTLVRLKLFSIGSCVLGTVFRNSIVQGVSFDGYFRQRFQTRYTSRLKLEYRLRLKQQSLFMILKCTIDNTRLSFPIELYRGDNCFVILVSLVVGSLLSPIVLESLRDVLGRVFCQSTTENYKIEDSLRKSFYAQFSAFGYSPSLHWINNRRHCSYVSGSEGDAEPPKGLEEVSLLREIKIAKMESESLRSLAKSNFSKEAKNDGLLIILGIYGHPKAIAEIFKSLNLQEYSCEFGSVTLERMLQNHSLSSYSKFLLDVTNVLMAKVDKSTLHISSFSKQQLIGFANPCYNLISLEPELMICYKIRGKINTRIYKDSDAVLIQ